MNICYDCSTDELSVEDEQELHYSEEFETDSESSDISEVEYLCWSQPPEKYKGKQVISILPQLKYFCRYKKNVGQTSSLPVPEFDPAAEQSFLKKMVKTNNILYIPVLVQVKNSWIDLDAFIDTDGSNNLARPSLFKGLWKPLQNILISETVGGTVNLTHYVDNISSKLGGKIIKVSAIQHYDPSASLFLGMPFINSIFPVTISKDKVIFNFKKQAISAPRLKFAYLEVRRESPKKTNTRKPKIDSRD